MSHVPEDAPRYLEILEVPRRYLEEDKESRATDTSPNTERLGRFLGALMYAGVSCAYRIETCGDTPRISYVVRTGLPAIEVVRTSFLAQFPDFVVRNGSDRLMQYDNVNLSAALLFGVPKQTVRSINGLIRSMMDSGIPSLYQVWATPRSPSWLTRYITAKQYGARISRTQKQETSGSRTGRGRVVMKTDADAQVSLERYAAAYRRARSDKLLECRVVLGFWGREQCKSALQKSLAVLLGTISREDKRERMRYRLLTGAKAGRLFETALSLGEGVKGTRLLPSEAVPFFEIPTIDVGIRQSNPASFTTWSDVGSGMIAASTPIPFVRGKVALGRVVRDGNLTSQTKFLELEDLRKHTTILGMTGSGKTTTKNRIVIDAWANGVPSLLIEPVKTDARALMGAIPELRVFTVGLEGVAPFRENPFDVAVGIPVQMHIDLLHTCFNSSWPVYGILSNHLRRVLLMSYVNNGWDVLRNTRGTLVTPETFLSTAETYSRRLPYGSELRQDFRGALLTRAEELCDPSRAAIFNTRHSLPIAELLSTPTVVELCHIGDPDFRAFLLSLLLMRVYEHFYVLGPAQKLRSLLVIDEAHSVLEELPKVTDPEAASGSRRKAADQQVNLVAESRSLGLGVVICDQNVIRLSRDAVKTCCTKMSHRQTSPEDRELVALETGCNAEQKAHLDVLRPGEVVVRGPSDSVPANVQVFHDPDVYPEMLKQWTDDDVRKRMMSFYAEHQDFARTPDIPVLDWGVQPQEDDTSRDMVPVQDIVHDDGYMALYLESISDPESERKRLVEDLLAYYLAKFRHDDEEVLDTAKAILDLSALTYGSPPYQPDMAHVKDLVSRLRRPRSESVRL